MKLPIYESPFGSRDYNCFFSERHLFSANVSVPYVDSVNLLTLDPFLSPSTVSLHHPISDFKSARSSNNAALGTKKGLRAGVWRAVMKMEGEALQRGVASAAIPFDGERVIFVFTCSCASSDPCLVDQFSSFAGGISRLLGHHVGRTVCQNLFRGQVHRRTSVCPVFAGKGYGGR